MKPGINCGWLSFPRLEPTVLDGRNDRPSGAGPPRSVCPARQTMRLGAYGR
jgi:hypothetical protein